MDTRTAISNDELAKQIAEIRNFMPKTYAYVKERQAEAMAKRGIKGEPNCFYAIENGRVKGAPFTVSDVPAELALQMVKYGFGFVCMVMTPHQKGDANGTH